MSWHLNKVAKSLGLVKRTILVKKMTNGINILFPNGILYLEKKDKSFKKGQNILKIQASTIYPSKNGNPAFRQFTESCLT